MITDEILILAEATTAVRYYSKLSLVLLAFCLLCPVVTAAAADSEQAGRTLVGLKGVLVSVEELQPNILQHEKYLQKAGLSKVQLKEDIEAKLKANGIKVLSPGEWSKTPGSPVLYININTHESEKYWFAYDIRLEVQQVVSLDARPEIKMLAVTWGVNMTGVVNTGTFNTLRNNAGVLAARFIQAYRAANK